MIDPSASRLAALRQELARQGLDGFIVPRADEHLGEYVPASAERLAWLTGFTGSAGLAAVLADKAAVFTDGRYVLQLAAQTDPAPVGAPPHHRGTTARLARRQRASRSQDRLRSAADQRRHAVALHRGWPRPCKRWRATRSMPSGPTGRHRRGATVVPHPLENAGRSATEKREQIAELLREAKLDAAVITDPASIAWLLNIRGGDVPFTPFALGFAVAHADGGTELFMDPAKLPDATRDWLGNTVSVADRDALAAGTWCGWPASGCGSTRRLAGLVRADAACRRG